MKVEFKPVIVGADIGAYSIARTFHEAYGVTSIVLCKIETWLTMTSKIIETKAVSNLDGDVLIKELIKLGKETPNIKKILFGCAEWYVNTIVENKSVLEEYYIIPYIDKETLDNIVLKENFYKICNKLKMDYPKTTIINKSNYQNVKVPYQYPFILKPSSNNKYNYAEFNGKKKIFIINNKKELRHVLNNIYHSSYDDSFIIQEFVPGDDSNMRVLTCYCDKNSNVVFSSFGQPLIEEKAPMAIGNYAAIINRENNEVLKQAKKFLKHVKYIGFANFDIKYNPVTKKYNFFEINVRLGRSNYYITGSGFNYAKYLVEEYIYNNSFNSEVIADNKWLYTIVPNYVIRKYVKDKKLVKEAISLRRKKRYSIATYYKKDLNFKRLIYFYLSYFNQIKKFKKYYR